MQGLKILSQGLMFIVMVGFAWYIWWTSSVSENEDTVARNLTQYAFQFSAASKARVEITYDKITPSGFPFGSHVRLVKPIFSIVSGSETYKIAAETMLFRASDSDQLEYEMETPAVFEMFYGKGFSVKEFYTVQVDVMPQITLRGIKLIATGKNGEKEKYFAQFAVRLPPKVNVRVSARDGKWVNVPVDFSAWPRAIAYRDLPKDLTPYMKYLVVTLRNAIKPPAKQY